MVLDCYLQGCEGSRYRFVRAWIEAFIWFWVRFFDSFLAFTPVCKGSRFESENLKSISGSRSGNQFLWIGNSLQQEYQYYRAFFVLELSSQLLSMKRWRDFLDPFLTTFNKGLSLSSWIFLTSQRSPPLTNLQFILWLKVLKSIYFNN